ncbi:MAG: mucoidy inhibitor MuiA family protein [Cyclobacteriaceae bacterium]|nr:mucoidy inhibitor MuiA family protein [Cyclobacteriaceae bacterium]
MNLRTLFFLIFSFSVFTSFSQTTKEVELKSSVTDVTVFLQNAQITRKGKVSIAPGKSTLVVKSLSPYVDDKSVQVKATGDFTILSVNHRLNYLNQLNRDSKIDSLTNLITKLGRKIDEKSSRKEVLAEKKSLLNANKSLGGQNSGVSLTELKQAIDLYDRELTSIKKEELDINEAIDNLKEQQSKLQKQINEVRGAKELPSGEVVIRVESKAKVEGNFTITYLVGNAGWFPKYDVRVKDVESPIKLSYKADVFQNTGVDWKNVKLKFSNGNPNQSGVAPELNTWYLNYARNTIYQSNKSYGVPSLNISYVNGRVTSADDGEPLPGVNVVVKGTTIGTVTDIDGNYSLTLPNNSSYLVYSFIGMVTQERPITGNRMDIGMQSDVTELSEVVVSGYAKRAEGLRIRGVSSANMPKKSSVVTTTTIENQTTVEFEVKTPYSIKSNGEKLTVDLSQYDIDALYQYYAAPKLDKDAFLIARIINWDQYNLLEGEANLYFEDAYVGRSILDAKSLVDTLDISLGRDKSIVIGREKVDEFSKRKTVGTNKVETRGFKLVVRNKKSQPIKLILHDQIPVASISDITVTPEELSGGKLDAQTGEITWDLELKPQEQKELILRYEVKYPKREKVILE